VLSGLTEKDTIVTGMEIQTTSAAGPSQNGDSPFMPKRPGNNNKKASSRQP